MKTKSKNKANIDPNAKDKESNWKKVYDWIYDLLRRQNLRKATRLIDDLFLGQFKDAVLDIFDQNKLSGMSDKKVDELEQRLLNSKEFQRNKNRVDASSRKDERTDWNIKNNSDYYDILWYDSDSKHNIGKQLSDLVAFIQKQAVETEKELQELKNNLSKMKVKIEDEDIGKYGAILKQMIDDKKSANEIQSKIDELKKKVDESRAIRMTVLESMGMPCEDKILLEYQCLFETQMFVDEMEYVLTEGWLRNLGKKTVGITKKSLKVVASKTVAPIIGLVGLGISTVFGGVLPTFCMRVMEFFEQNGKMLANSIERQYTRYKNHKGVITKMDFETEDGGNYSLRFYDKDKVWRLLNLDDQLHHPNVKQT